MTHADVSHSVLAAVWRVRVNTLVARRSLGVFGPLGTGKRLRWSVLQICLIGNQLTCWTPCRGRLDLYGRSFAASPKYRRWK